MKKTWKSYPMMRAVFCGIALLSLFSCTESPSSPTSSGSNVVMRTELDSARIHSTLGTSTPSSLSTVDSLDVTSVAYAASDFTLRSDISDEANDPNPVLSSIRPPQFLLVFDASGRQYIGESIVYPTTYRRARFAIHSLVGRADSLSLALGPLYSALFASGNSTIVIRGYLWISGVAMPFMFRSAEEGVGSAEFDTPFTVGTDLPKEVLVNFSTVSAFTDVSGKIMDPRDGRNAAAIEAHLKTSLHAIVNPESR